MLDKKAKNYKEKETLQHRHQTPVCRKRNDRPNPIIDHISENDNSSWQQRIVPGNSKYSDTVRNGKKTFIVRTSMVKSIRMREVNSQSQNLFAKLRLFPRATLKHLRYCIVPSLIDDTPNRIILEIADVAILCRDYGDNDVFMSAMFCRSDKFLNGKVKSKR